MPAPNEITDVLGRTKSVQHSWPDGSWQCPFCGYGCKSGDSCQNPACLANPHYPIARSREVLAAEERRQSEEAARTRNAEWALKRATEDRQARDQHIADVQAEAARRGACIRCALKDSWRVKYVKHRVKCPLER